MTTRLPVLERDLVSECAQVAAATNACLAVVGQRRARGSGTTIGYPDMTLICNGHTILIEAKRPRSDGTPGGALTKGQVEFIRRAAEQHVCVRVVETLDEFVQVLNACRRERVR